MNKLNELEALIRSEWKQALSQPRIANFVDTAAASDRRIIAIYLIQVYHYAFHTARNQALVGINLANTDTKYMQFCFEHALEETGHELMALHDLQTMGIRFKDRIAIPQALPATELLIAYLYYVASQGNPVQRLGYSYWSETSYSFIRAFMDMLMQSMKLEKSQMTFFYSHSHIDDKHAKDVAEIIVKVCKTDKDWEAVMRVAKTTLKLTNDMFHESFEEFLKLTRGEASAYAFINEQIIQSEGFEVAK
ncbi:MAG: iron-containing redox enzyme family protein [Flammeovirgaceae bacterium]